MAAKDQEEPRTYMVTEPMMLARDWTRKQMPAYRVDEVAKIFFGMSASWLRLRMSADPSHPRTWFVTETGERMDFRRKDPDRPGSAREFWLSDIEPMAYSLRDFGTIDDTRLVQILEVVRAQAVLYSLFETGDCPADEIRETQDA